MLEAVNLTKRYNGVTALDDLTLQVAPGEVFCLLGANGAGKTTTINLFLNFIQPTSGTARIAGIDVTEQPLETKRYVAYIPETVMLYKNLTGLENLEYFSALAGHAHYTRADLLGLLRQVGLQDGAADQRVGAYSKGMRQKVGIAIALAKNAKALPRAALLAAAYVAYFATFVAIAFGVSALARSSRAALVVLLAFWFVNSLIVTRAAADFVTWLYPTPSAVEFQQALEQDLSNPEDMRVRLEQWRQELMREYNVQSPEALPISFQGISLQEGENHGNEVFDRHYGRLYDTYVAQNRAVQWTGVAAPMLTIGTINAGFAPVVDRMPLMRPPPSASTARIMRRVNTPVNRPCEHVYRGRTVPDRAVVGNRSISSAVGGIASWNRRFPPSSI